MKNDTRGISSLRAERAIPELRRGRAIEIVDDLGSSLVGVIERLDLPLFDKFLSPDNKLRITITAERARALEMRTKHSAVEIRLDGSTTPAEVQTLVGMASLPETTDRRPRAAEKANPRAAAGCRLAKLAKLLPAVLSVDVPAESVSSEHLRVTVADIQAYHTARDVDLIRASSARVPLTADEHCEVIAYRERFADEEHVAVVIGKPDPSTPMLVRLHSACFTGDVLDSLRCDCGDQLRGAALSIASAGGGIILYLAQEGRGIGLINKLRAYALQDTGLDTLEANMHLGFKPDERDYSVASEMLNDLGIAHIRLLTSNPDKIAALEERGIEVVGRVTLPVCVNPHNDRYLRTKREQAGHLDSVLEN